MCYDIAKYYYAYSMYNCGIPTYTDVQCSY